MGIMERIDMELQKDLLDFVKAEKERSGKTLGESLTVDILEKLIGGDCKMTGCCTDHEKKKMFIEFTFYQDDEEDE